MPVLTKVGTVNSLKPGEKTVVELEGVPIALYNVNGTYYATEDVCTHDGGPLADGELKGYEIICPRHGARFDVRTGKALCMPAFTPVNTYPVTIQGNDIFIEF
jgi:3-phenylpropionate/trans-cinnamate dioxygenase ferredoxin component